MPWWRNHSSSAGNYLLSYLVEFITGWSNWILLRKLNYSICFFIDVIVKLERALSNSLQSTSVSCLTLFWTTLYSRGSFLVYSWPVLLLCLLLSKMLSKMFRLTWSNCLAHFFPWRIIQSIVRLHQIWSKGERSEPLRYSVRTVKLPTEKACHSNLRDLVIIPIVE